MPTAYGSAAPATAAEPRPPNSGSQDKTHVQKLSSTLGVWLARTLTAVFVVLYGGAVLVGIGLVCYWMIWGAVSILQAAAQHVVQTVEITDSATLDRNLVLGSAIALLAATWLAVRWRRQRPAWSKRRRAAAWVMVFGLVCSVMFVGGEAAAPHPQAPSTTRLAAGPRPPAAQPVTSNQSTGAAAAGQSSSRRASGVGSSPGSAPAPAPGSGLAQAPPVTTPQTDVVAPVQPSTAPTATAVTRTVYVSNTDGQGVYLRATPRWDDRLGAVTDGTSLVVTSPTSISGDGTDWLQVRASDNSVVYVPSQYVSDVQPSPTPIAAQEPIVPPAATALVTRTAVQSTRQTTPTMEQPQISSAGFVTIGSSADQVSAVEGPPSARYPTYWTYGLATISFDQRGRVAGWANAESRLHVILAGADSRSGEVFALNSSKADVAAVQGVPSGYYPTYWSYGLATVTFAGDRVSGWANTNSVLRVSMPGAGTRQQDTFSVGARRSDVAAVQGVPSGYYPTYWSYGLATVQFEGDRVNSWSNSGNTLRVTN